jgi:hypothetical protein
MRWLLIILLPLVISSCELFSTRTPEEPETGGTGYIPPTSYDLVIENLKNSIKERNLNNYLLCFSDSSFTGISEYVFTADPLISAQFQGIFAEWNIESEGKYFTSLMTNVLEETSPSVSFSNVEYKNFNDSIVFTGTYYLNLDLANDLSNETYSGSTRIVLKNSTTGFWYITSWYDFQSDNSNALSWSYLKSKYYY